MEGIKKEAVTKKELKKLGRTELLELLIRMSKENTALTEKIDQLELELERRELAVRGTGNLAEAALAVTKIFEEADKAAAIYKENIRRTSANQRLITQTIIADARRKAERIIADAQRTAAGQGADTRTGTSSGAGTGTGTGGSVSSAGGISGSAARVGTGTEETGAENRESVAEANTDSGRIKSGAENGSPA